MPSGPVATRSELKLKPEDVRAKRARHLADEAVADQFHRQGLRCREQVEIRIQQPLAVLVRCLPGGEVQTARPVPLSSTILPRNSRLAPERSEVRKVAVTASVLGLHMLI